ncbi:hypothetical protein GCM10011369_04340 [Neiella marina]|uniref:Uncharacterized protein n=1 Tax=Neiella marina TaxID=508461 RepID=A0A8J2U2I4_9GAMM|nr:hypothetical protein [Neiella marina]GGA65948.1 hypothetical protein GCM10011369_04340 [Neiella marina]
MTTPPQELVTHLTRLAEIFAVLRRKRQQFVSPQQALPNLELAHQCSQIARIFTALESTNEARIDGALDKLETTYFNLGKLGLAAGLRSARHNFHRHLAEQHTYAA